MELHQQGVRQSRRQQGIPPEHNHLTTHRRPFREETTGTPQNDTPTHQSFVHSSTGFQN